MDRLLAQLTDRLTKTYGDRLVSVILYGSGAAPGNHDSQFSDLNIFCVLTEISPRELAESEGTFQWWRELGNPPPLLMTEEETVTSTDSFPIEFHDMQERRKLLWGRDIIAGLEIDRRYWRAHLEQDLRAKMLRLRQQATGALSDRDALLKLCIDSVSTFCVLGRHALLIAGKPVGWKKREVAEALGAALGSDFSPFLKLLDVREGKAAPQEVDPVNLFGNYLKRIQELITFVDRQETRES